MIKTEYDRNLELIASHDEGTVAFATKREIAELKDVVELLHRGAVATADLDEKTYQDVTEKITQRFMEWSAAGDSNAVRFTVSLATLMFDDRVSYKHLVDYQAALMQHLCTVSVARTTQVDKSQPRRLINAKRGPNGVTEYEAIG